MRPIRAIMISVLALAACISNSAAMQGETCFFAECFGKITIVENDRKKEFYWGEINETKEPHGFGRLFINELKGGVFERGDGSTFSGRAWIPSYYDGDWARGQRHNHGVMYFRRDKRWHRTYTYYENGNLLIRATWEPFYSSSGAWLVHLINKQGPSWSASCEGTAYAPTNCQDERLSIEDLRETIFTARENAQKAAEAANRAGFNLEGGPK